MLSSDLSIYTDPKIEIQWRVLIQRANGRNFSHALSVHSGDSGEEVMKKLRRLYIENTPVGHRVLSQTILMRRPVVAVVRLTAVCPQRLTFGVLNCYP